MFVKLSGLDESIVDGLEKPDRFRLKLSSAWVVVGIGLSGFSAGYVFYFCMNSLIAGIFTGLFIGLFLFALQIVLVSGTLGNVEVESDEFEKRKKLKSNFFLFLITGLFLSQPILFLTYKNLYPTDIKNQAEQNKLLARSYYEKNFKANEALIQREISYNKELLNQITDTSKPLQTNESRAKEAFFLSSTRKALVIGNQSYSTSPLHNPLKDAKDLSEALSKIGFGVRTIYDANQLQMEKGLVDYYKTLRPGDISFVYFSGHGFQDHGNNYLVPIDFDLSDKSKAVALNVIIESISQHALLANVLVVDACRSYTFGSSGGLASSEAGINTYIALSAKPGQYSLDGKPGTNGIFTAALLKNINQKVDIDTLFRRVRKDVLLSSKNSQETWSSNSLNGTLILASSGPDKNQNLLLSQNDIEKNDKSGISCAKIANNATLENKRNQVALCSSAKLFKLEDDLFMHQKNSRKYLEEFDKTNHKKVITKSEALNAFYSVYIKHPLFSIVVSFITTLLLSGGFVWRHLIGDEFSKYEFIFHKIQRESVFESAQYFSTIAAKLPHANKNFVQKAYEVNQTSSRPKIQYLITGEKAKNIIIERFR
jgi:hypothetical protein